jgi:hypothetical protein
MQKKHEKPKFRRKKTLGSGRPKGCTYPVRKLMRAYRISLDILEFFDTRDEPSTWIIEDAIRAQYPEYFNKNDQ